MALKLSTLGFYLIFAGMFEMVATLFRVWPVYLLPRIGWEELLVTWRITEAMGTLDFPVEVASACSLLLLGTLFCFEKRPLKTYVASVILLSPPSWWFAFSLLYNETGDVLPGDWAVAFAFFLLVVLTVFDFVPTWMAIRLLREGYARKPCAQTG